MTEKNLPAGLQRKSGRLALWLSLLIVVQIGVPPATWAQGFRENRAARDAAAQAAMSGFSSSVPLDLDLSSTTKSFSTANLNMSGALNINVAGGTRTINPGDMLTAAELVAAHQVLSGANQSLRVGQDGSATGGRFSLTGTMSESIGNLVVPQHVKLLQNFSDQASLNLAGNLTNSGKLVVFSTNPAQAQAAFSAANIYNQPGALISSMGSGVAGALGSVDLTLSALGEIVNSGTIISSGSLNLSANSIVNALPANVSGAQPLISAYQNLNMQAASVVNQGQMLAQNGNMNVATANLVNSGLMQSLAGDLTVANLSFGNLTVDNAGGTMLAGNALSFLNKQGMVDELGNLVKSDMNVYGGTLLASALNFDAGQNNFDLNVQDLGGTVYVDAGHASLKVTEGTHHFVLGRLNVSNDPPLDLTVASFDDGGTGYASTGLGDYVRIVTTSGGITFTGNILTTPPVSGDGGYVELNSADFISVADINASANDTGNGGNITLIAATSVTAGTVVTNAGSNGGNAGAIHIEANGGAVNTLDLGAISDAAVGGNGGAITVEASTDVNTGWINAYTLNGGNGAGTPDPITEQTGVNITAGGSFTTTGGIDTTSAFVGGAGAGGNINVLAGGDIIADTPGTWIDTSSYATSGSGNHGGNIQLIAGGNVSAVWVGAHGSLNGGLEGNGGNVIIDSATGAVNLSDSIVTRTGAFSTGSAGFVHISAEDGINIAGVIDATAYPSSGSGGAITLTTTGINADIATGFLANSGSAYGSPGGTVDTVSGNRGTHVSATGNVLIDGVIDSQCFSCSQLPGIVVIKAGGSVEVTGNIVTSSGGSLTAPAGDIYINAGSSVTLQRIEATHNVESGGDVVIWAGNINNNATITLTSVSTRGGKSGGLIEIVNSSLETASTNLSILETAGNAIESSAFSLDGLAGPIALVSSGGISVAGGILATADFNPSSTAAMGGGVFISSGGTGVNAISLNNITTSATNGSGNIAGNVILLSSDATTGADPANITYNSITQDGGTTGTALVWGLNGASSTLPASLNVTPTSSINIRPGGYQQVAGSSGSPIALTIDGGGDTQMVVPINIGDQDLSGNSIYLSGITQASLTDNINIVSLGNIVFSGAISTDLSTGHIELFTAGSISATENLALSANFTTLGMMGGLYFSSAATGPGNWLDAVSYVGGLNALGNITTASPTVGNGGSIYLEAVDDIFLHNIDSAGSDAGNGGSLFITSLSASVFGGSVSTRGGSTSGNGGDIDVVADNGSITFTNFVESRAGTGSTSGVGGHIFMSAANNGDAGAYDIRLVSLTSQGSTETAGGGEINLNAPFAGQISIQQFIDSSATPGVGAPDGVGNGGDITISASNGVTFGSIRSVGGDSAGDGGDIEVTTAFQSIVGLPYGSVTLSFIDSSACQCDGDGLNAGTAGNITISASQSFSGSSIRADGGWSGGNGGIIGITATNGSVSTDFISASAQPPTSVVAAFGANAGSITIQAGLDIVGTTYRTQGGIGSGNGGPVQLISDFGSLTADLIGTQALGDGLAGVITSQTATGITLSIGATASGLGAMSIGNNITFLVTSGGDLNYGALFAYGGIDTGNGGDVSLTISGGTGSILGTIINTAGGLVNGNGGNITLTATSALTLGDIYAAGGTGIGDGGDISLQAGLDIQGTHLSSFGAQTSGNSGTIYVYSDSGAVDFSGNINANNAGSGNGGEIGITAATGIHAGSIGAAGGPLAGSGAVVGASTLNGDIVVDTFISSRAKAEGNGGNISLNAYGGRIAVLGTIATGASIVADGAGTGNAGYIGIAFGADEPFVVDPNGVGITNGAKGNISARATGSGDGGAVDFANYYNDLVITLNGTVDASASSGSSGSVNFTATGYNLSVVGNVDGDLRGLISGYATFDITFDLAKPATIFEFGSVMSIGGTIAITTAATSGISVATSIDGPGDINLTTSSVNNAGFIDSASGIITIENTGDLTISGAGAITAQTGSPSIFLTSTAGSVDATQNTFTGWMVGDAFGDFSISIPTGTLSIGTIDVGGSTINVSSSAGDLTLDMSTIFTVSGAGQKNISLSANGGDLLANQLLTFRADGGQASLSASDEINVGYLVADATTVTGNATNLSMTAPNGISAVNISAQGGATSGNGGNLEMVSTNGAINIPSGFLQGDINTSAPGGIGNAGYVYLSASSGITVDEIAATAIGSTRGNGGAVYLTTSGAGADIIVTSIDNSAFGTGSAGANVYFVDGRSGVNISAAGDVSVTNYILSRASINGGTGNGGAVNINALGTVNVANFIGTSAFGTYGIGGNIYVHASGDITLGTMDTHSDNASAGFVQIWGGNGTTASNISLGSIITEGLTAGGLVQVVNSSPFTPATNLTISNTITTDAHGLDGRAGPVALVSTGAINTSDIQTRSNYNGASTNALGGGIFVSSGGTGANAIAVGNLDTSANSSGAGNKAGNIILLSSDTTTGADPTNISYNTLQQDGGTPGTALVWGLAGAASTLPANLDVTPTSAINIQPGGYQQVAGSVGSPLALNIYNGNDPQMVVPINIGAVDGSNNSLYVSSITTSGSTPLSFVLEGNMVMTGPLTADFGSGSFSLLSQGSLSVQDRVDIRSDNIILNTGITVTSPLAPLSTPYLLLAATSVLSVSGSITTIGANGSGSTNGSNGGSVYLFGGDMVSVGSINTSGGSSDTGSYGNGGDVVIWTGNSLNTATLTVGDVTTSGANAGRVELVNSAQNTFDVNLTAGNITAQAIAQDGLAGPVALVASGAIQAGNIDTRATNVASNTQKGGGVFVSSGGTGTNAITVGNIDTTVSSIGVLNLSGNVILLSAAASSGVSPANIAHGTINVNGSGTDGVSFVYGLNGASNTLPASLNVTPTASINIRPGGYQQVAGSSGSPLALTITSGNYHQSLIPINIGAKDASGNSMYLSTITQTAIQDNVDLVAAGNFVFSADPTIDFATGSFSYFTQGTMSVSGGISANANKTTFGALTGTNVTTNSTIGVQAIFGINVLGDISSIGSNATLTATAGDVLLTGGLSVNAFGNIAMRGNDIDYYGTLYTGISQGTVTMSTNGQAPIGLGGTNATNLIRFGLTDSELQNISTGNLSIGGGTATVYNDIDLTSDLLTNLTIHTGTNNGCFGCVAAQPYEAGTFTLTSGPTSTIHLRASTLTSGEITGGAFVDIEATGLVNITGGVATNSGGNIDINAPDIDYTGMLNTGNGAGSVVLSTVGHADVGLGGTTVTNTEPFRLTLSELENISTGTLTIGGGNMTVFSDLDLSSQNLQQVNLFTNANNGCIGCTSTLPYDADPLSTGTGYIIDLGSSGRLAITASTILSGAITAGPVVNLLATDGGITISGSSAGISTSAFGQIILRADDLEYSGSLSTGVSQGSIFIRTNDQGPVDIGQVTPGSMNLSLAEITNIYTDQFYLQGGATTVHANLDLSAQNLLRVEIDTWIVNGCCGGTYLPYDASAFSLNVGSSANLFIVAASIATGQVTAGNIVQFIGQTGLVDITGGITTNNNGSVLIRSVDLDYTGTINTGLSAGSVTLGTVNQADLEIAGSGPDYNLSLAELTSITTGQLYLTGGETRIYADVNLSLQSLTRVEIMTNLVNNCCGGAYLPINADPLSTGSAHTINVGSTAALFLTGGEVTVGQLTAGPSVQVVAEDVLNMTGASAGIQTNANGLIRLVVGAINYTGVLHTGFQLGQIKVATFGQLPISLGGTSETFNLTNAELANITTNYLIIEGGQITLDSNIDLDPNDLVRVDMLTNVVSDCCGGPPQPFVGGSFTIDVGATSQLYITSSSLTVGNLIAGPLVELRALANTITLNGGVSTNAGGTIRLIADAITYSGILNTGNALGLVTFNPSTPLTTVGLGGDTITNTSTVKFTNALLGNIQTGTLHIGGGEMTVYSNIDLSASDLVNVQLATNEWSLCCGATIQPYDGGTYMMDIGQANLSVLASNITTGSVTAGSIVFSSNSSPASTLTVPINARLFASNGNIALQNYNNGQISIGQNAIISAAGPAFGTGSVFIGNPALSCCPAGTTPANVAISIADNGAINFGNAGLNASAPTNTVSATATTVNFNVSAAGNLTLGGGVIISGCGGCGGGGGGPVFPALINSLDFTDAAVIDLITNLQAQGIVGGSLGSGTVTLPVGIVQPIISAQNITPGLEVTVMTSGAPLYGWHIEIDAQSTSSQVIIDGSMYYTNIVPANTGAAYITVASDQPGPVVVISGTGEVVSDGDFNIGAAGAISNSGSVTAQHILWYTTGANGDITTNSIVSTLDNPIFAVTLTASQGLTINGDIETNFGGLISLTGATLNYTGNLDTGVGAGEVYLMTADNDVIGGIGGGSHVAPWHVSQGDLDRITTGNLFIFTGQLTQYANIDTTAKNFDMIDIRTNVNGPLLPYQPYIGGSFTWTTSTQTDLSIAAETITVGSISAGPLVSLVAAESPGTLTVNGGITTATGGEILLSGATLDYTGMLNTGLTVGTVTLRTMNVGVEGSIGGSSEAWNITNAELANITTGNLNIYTGQLTQDSNIDLTANDIENVDIRTNVNLPLTLFESYIGGSLSFTAGPQTNLAIRSSSIAIGSISAGNLVTLAAVDSSLNVNGNITTANGGEIDLMGATMDFTGTLDTGTSSGLITLRVNDVSVLGSVGGAGSAAWNVTNAELANIDTSYLRLYTGQLTQDSNIDVSANAFDTLEIRTNANLPLTDHEAYIGNSLTYTMGPANLIIHASSISVGAISAGPSVFLHAHDSTLDVNGNVSTQAGGAITLYGSTMDYDGTLNTGSSTGSVTLGVNDVSVIGGIGGTTITNTAPWEVTLAKLQNITTGNLNITSGQLTVYGNIDLSASGLDNVNIWTNGLFPLTDYEAYIGGSFTVDLGSQTNLSIDAASISSGSVNAGAFVTMRAWDTSLTIDGGITTLTGGTITLLGGTMDFTGVLNTGGVDQGHVFFQTNSNDVIGGLGGDGISNLAPWNLTISELQNTSTGTLNINSGELTVYGDIDLTASLLISMTITTNHLHSGPTHPYRTYDGQNFTVNIDGPGDLFLTASNIITGSLIANTMIVTNTEGQLTVPANATILSEHGDVVLRNLDTVNGTILLDTDSHITGVNGGINGNVYIFIGNNVPVAPAVGPTPSNTVLNPTGGGQIFFDTNGITGNAPTNYVNTNGAQVIFSTGARPASAITMNGGVIINDNAPPPPGGPIDSLDLTDSAVTSLLLSLQSSLQIGGTLLVDSGVAYGGNVIIAPSMLANTLTAANIPANVVVTLDGFTPAKPVVINLTGTSTTTQVIIGGTHEFTGGGNGIVNITSNQAGPVLLIENTGLLSSDGGLSVTANGNMSIDGTVSVTAALTLQTTANNGSISYSGEITGVSSVFMSTHAMGNITRTTAVAGEGIITGATIAFSTGGGSVGTLGNPVLTQATNVSATTSGSGNVFITQSGAVNLQGSTVGGQLRLLATNNITTTGNVTANVLYLETTASNGNILLNSNLTAQGLATLTTNGNGIVTVSATRALASVAGNVMINTHDVDIAGTVSSGASTFLRPNGDINISVSGLSGASSAPFEVDASELSKITARTLVIGSFSRLSEINVIDDIDVSGGGPAQAYNLNFQTAGNYVVESGVAITLGSHSLSVSVQGNANTGDVFGGVFAAFSAAQALTVDGDVTVNSGGTIQVRGASIDMSSGSLTANGATGTVFAAPYGALAIALGGTGGSAPFELTTEFLDNISTTTLVVGEPFVAGGVTIIGDLDLSLIGPQQLNIQNGGNFTNSSSLTLGTKYLTVNVQGSISTGDILGGSLISLQTPSALNLDGDIIMTAGVAVLQANSYDFTGGSLNAGQGLVILRPTTAQAITVGGAGGVTPFEVTSAMLASISAAALVIGDLSLGGGMTVASNLNTAAAYSLYLFNAGNIDASGRTITVGNRSFGMQAGGTLDTGTISGGTGSIGLVAGGTLTVSGAVTTAGLGSLTLMTSSGSNGNIVLNASVGGGGYTTLSANGSGNISQSTGTISGGLIRLSSTSGNIGTGVSALEVSGTTLSTNTGGSGVVNLNTTGSMSLSSSSAGGDFILTAAGSVTLASIATLNGSITVEAGAGALIVRSDAVIFANEGNLTLQNHDTVGGTIVIGNGAELEGFTISNPLVGNVYIVIGSVPGVNVPGTAPGGVTVNEQNGGHVYFNVPGISTSAGNNQLNAIGRDIVFSTGGLSASAIVLAGDTTITADPPSMPHVTLPSSNASNPINVLSGVQNTALIGVSGPRPLSSPGGGGGTGGGGTGGGGTGGGTGNTGGSGGSGGSGSGGSGSGGTGGSGSGGSGSGGSGSGGSGSGSGSGGSGGAPAIVLTSLDLTDKALISLILDAQATDALGGTLIVKNGMIKGGTLILTPDNLASSLTAAHIPNRVTITFEGFQSTSPININLSSGSSSKQVIVNGSGLFVGSGGVGADSVINITSDLSGVVLVIGKGGLLSTSGMLAVNANGGMVVNGNLTGNITLSTTNNGALTLNGNIGSSSSVFTFNLGGSGNLVQKAGMVTATTLVVQSATGNIGALKTALKTNVSGLISASTGGNGVVNISNIGPTQVDNILAGGSVIISSSNSLQVGDVSSTNGSTSLISKGNLAIENGAELFAGNGNLTLQNKAMKGSGIEIGEGADLDAQGNSKGLGNVFIVIGNVPAKGTEGANPTDNTFARVAGGNVYFGKAGVTMPDSVIINASGANVLFNNGSKSGAITLEENVTIDAVKILYANESKTEMMESIVDTGDYGDDADAEEGVTSYLPQGSNN